MTGDLNMDGHNIKNVNHINTGSINTTGEITIESNLSVKGTINTASLYGAYIKSSGNIDSNGNISGNAIYGNYIKANGSIEASSNISGKDIKASGNIDASGNVSGNAVYGNYIKSKGRIAADEFIYINAQAGIVDGCSPNGLQGRSPEEE